MKHHLLLPTALLAMVSVAGCSTVAENSRLNEARNDYRAAQDNPQVVKHAPVELKQAGDALARANDASSRQDDAAEVTHLAYLAKQRSAIAQETATQKEAETAVANAGTERSKIRLDARTDEADRARLDADTSQREADAARQQADAARHQSEMSQQQARDAEQRTGQLEAELKELNAKRTERGLVITLGDVLFDTNQAQLKPGGTRSLQKLAGFLKRYPQRNAQVEGHTDNTGGAEYNQALSDRRADTVRTYLVDMGIDNQRIATRGFGDVSPVASNNTASGRQLNRRVEIILSDEKKDVSVR